jgi:hypothetical protein
MVGVEYHYVDNHAQSRIEMTYVNNSGVTVCMSPEFWPNEYGNIDSSPDFLGLVVKGQRYKFKETSMGYCFNEDCVFRVRPGERIFGFIKYQDFNLPAELFTEQKYLDFSPTGYKC